MSKENFERFMKQVDDSQELQAKIGEEITGEALVALGAAHGCEFSIADVQAGAELSDAKMEAASGGVYAAVNFKTTNNDKLPRLTSLKFKLRASRPRVGTDASFLSIHKK